MAPRRNCSVIVFDLCYKRKQALQVLMRFTGKNYFSNSKDLTKLILFNCTATNNQLATEFGGFTHIVEATSIVQHSPIDALNAVEAAIPAPEADWLEALAVGLHCLLNDFVGVSGVANKQLIVISDLKTASGRAVQSMATNINEANITLYIIGPCFKITKHLKNCFDVDQHTLDSQQLYSTENNKILVQFVREIHKRVIAPVGIGSNLLFSYRNGSNTWPWKVPLQIGSSIKLPILTFKTFRKNDTLKLTQEKKSHSSVQWINPDNPTEIIDPANILQGTSHHGKFVKMDSSMMGLFKWDNSRSFTNICFTDRRNVPDYLMTGEGSYTIFPDTSIDDSEYNNDNVAMFVALHRCLVETQTFAIVRRVYNANSNPKLFVVGPSLNEENQQENGSCFSFFASELPFADDMRADYKESSPPTKITTNTSVVDSNLQLAVYEFLDSLDYASLQPEVFPLTFGLMHDPFDMHVLNRATEKLIDRKLYLDECDIDLFHLPRSKDAEDKLKQMMPERVINTQMKELQDYEAYFSDKEYEEP